MAAHVWTGRADSTVLDLLDRRLGADADGQYLDVCGTSVSAAAVAPWSGR